MNMVEATLERANGGARRGARRASGSRSTTSSLADRPALAATTTGARRRSASGPRTSRTRRSRRTRRRTSGCAARSMLREALGSEIMAHFTVERTAGAAPRTSASSRRTSATRAPSGAERRRDETTMVGRFGARSRRQAGRRRRGRRRHARAALLRPRDRARDLRRRRQEKEQRHEETRCDRARARAARPALLARRGGGGDGGRADDDRRRRRRRATSRARSRSWRTGPATSRSRSRPCSTASRRRTRTSRSSTTRSATSSPTVLSTAVQGGNPPDIADVAQPGLDAGLREQGALKPIDFAQDDDRRELRRRLASQLGTVDGKLYGLFFKGANKSTVWYNVTAFKNAGVEAAEDVGRRSSTNAETLSASGTPAYSIGGADGWTLTDLFENIYLRTAGPDEVRPARRRTRSRGPTSRSRTRSRTMAKVLGDTDEHRRRHDGRAADRLPDLGRATSSRTSPKAAMVIEGDFVPGASSRRRSKPVTGYNVFPFPSSTAPPPAVVGGGDIVVMFKDTPAARALVEYLATPEAAEIWAKRGGFSSPEQERRRRASIRTTITRDDGERARARPRSSASTCPTCSRRRSAARPGRAKWKLFQDFLQNPDDVDGTAQQLEAAAAKAYKARSRMTLARSDNGGAPASGGSARRAARPAGWRSYARRRPRSSRPRSSSSASGSSTRPINTIVRSFFDRTATSSSGSTTTRRSSPTTRSLRRSRTTRSGSLVVPALVTAIGLVFAVLTERIALGGRVQDGRLHADGDLALRRRRDLAGHVRAGSRPRRRQRGDRRSSQDAVRPAGRALGRAAVDRRRSTGSPEQGFVARRSRWSPGGVALLGLTGIPPDEVPDGAEAGGRAGAAPGRHHRRRLAGLQARRRHAGQGREGGARPARRDGRAPRRRRRRRSSSTTTEADGTFASRTSRPAATRSAIGVGDLRASRSAASPGSARS